MKFRLWSFTALVACSLTAVSFAAGPDAGSKIAPHAIMQLQPAVERSAQQMDAFDATNALSGATRDVPFRPTVSAAEYAAMKNVRGMAAAGKPSMGSLSATGGNGSVLTKFVGPSECDGPGGCWIPPDVAGAIGKGQFVSTSNDMIEVRSRAGALLKLNSLNGFFGYATTSMFDPRVIYDEEYQRWIVTADSFQQSGGTQLLGIAISQTNSATGKWWIYFVSVNTSAFVSGGGFYDYPMLGMTQDALLFTANEFPNSGGAYSTLFSIAKARLYNGFGASFPVFTGLFPTLEPAHQLVTDQNPYAWLAAYTGSSINMYYLGFGANAFSAFIGGPIAVSGVPSASGPPPAQQPGSCAPAGANLDSLDGRFQNTGTQNGDLYYQVHSEGIGSFPAPRYFVINNLSNFAPAVLATNFVFASSTSYDFNPSITADANNHFGINWSYTDTGVNASLRFVDNNGGNPGPGTGTTVFTSASCWTGVGTNRWGDYSSTTYDPGTGTVSSLSTNTFWITNETTSAVNFWSTEIAKMKY